MSKEIIRRKYREVLVHFDAFQNPISLCCKSRDMNKCRSEVNMPEWNYNMCNLQMKFIATNYKYEYILSFSLEMILESDKSFTKPRSCRLI